MYPAPEWYMKSKGFSLKRAYFDKVPYENGQYKVAIYVSAHYKAQLRLLEYLKSLAYDAKNSLAEFKHANNLWQRINHTFQIVEKDTEDSYINFSYYRDIEQLIYLVASYFVVLTYMGNLSQTEMLLTKCWTWFRVSDYSLQERAKDIAEFCNYDVINFELSPVKAQSFDVKIEKIKQKQAQHVERLNNTLSNKMET